MGGGRRLVRHGAGLSSAQSVHPALLAVKGFTPAMLAVCALAFLSAQVPLLGAEAKGFVRTAKIVSAEDIGRAPPNLSR